MKAGIVLFAYFIIHCNGQCTNYECDHRSDPNAFVQTTEDSALRSNLQPPNHRPTYFSRNQQRQNGYVGTIGAGAPSGNNRQKHQPQTGRIVKKNQNYIQFGASAQKENAFGTPTTSEVKQLGTTPLPQIKDNLQVPNENPRNVPLNPREQQFHEQLINPGNARHLVADEPFYAYLPPILHEPQLAYESIPRLQDYEALGNGDHPNVLRYTDDLLMNNDVLLPPHNLQKYNYYTSRYRFEDMKPLSKGNVFSTMKRTLPDLEDYYVSEYTDMEPPFQDDQQLPDGYLSFTPPQNYHMLYSFPSDAELPFPNLQDQSYYHNNFDNHFTDVVLPMVGPKQLKDEEENQSHFPSLLNLPSYKINKIRYPDVTPIFYGEAQRKKGDDLGMAGTWQTVGAKQPSPYKQATVDNQRPSADREDYKKQQSPDLPPVLPSVGLGNGVSSSFVCTGTNPRICRSNKKYVYKN